MFWQLLYIADKAKRKKNTLFVSKQFSDETNEIERFPMTHHNTLVESPSCTRVHSKDSSALVNKDAAVQKKQKTLKLIFFIPLPKESRHHAALQHRSTRLPVNYRESILALIFTDD